MASTVFFVEPTNLQICASVKIEKFFVNQAMALGLSSRCEIGVYLLPPSFLLQIQHFF